MARHKWNGKLKGNGNDGKGGIVVACINCECVKELVQSRVTYFVNDTVYDKAPKCINPTNQGER